MARRSPSISGSLAMSNSMPGVALVLLVVSMLVWEYEGFVVEPPSVTLVYGGAGSSSEIQPRNIEQGDTGLGIHCHGMVDPLPCQALWDGKETIQLL